MLSDLQIDTITMPLVDAQQELSARMVNTIAKRVGEIKELETDVLIAGMFTIPYLSRTQSDVKNMRNDVLATRATQKLKIRKALQNLVKQEWLNARPDFIYRGIKQSSMTQNATLMEALEESVNEVNNVLDVINNPDDIGFMTKRGTDSRVQVIEDAYRTIINEATMIKQNGVLNFDEAMEKALRQLNDGGLKTLPVNGRSMSIDGVARMRLLSAIRKLDYETQLEIGRIVGADGVELSAHSFSAPDHEPIQGHLFTIENFDRLQDGEAFEDTYGIKFEPVRRPIGAWNCKHFTQVVILENRKPTWSLEDLEELKRANAEGYTTKDGRHYTMYQCTQIQRDYERRIRDAKRGIITARNAKNDALKLYYELRLGQLNREYGTFCKSCGLKKDRSRTFVDGFMESA